MARWQIKYSQEVDNYFNDNGMLVRNLYLAILAVAQNNGLPDSPYSEGPRIEISFDVENHTVVYERWLTQKMIRITQIIPGPDI